MLEEILAKETCARCRFCCEFDGSDLWEMPLLDRETREAAERLLPRARFAADGDDARFAVVPPAAGQCVDCPARTAQGCALGGRAPFECRLWPLRALERDGRLCLALAPGCPHVGTLPRERVAAHARRLAPAVAAYVAAHPRLVHPWRDEYTWLCDL